MLGLKTQMRVIKQLIRHWHGTLRGPSGLDEAYWQLFFNGSMLQDSDSLFTTCILPSGLVPSRHKLANPSDCSVTPVTQVRTLGLLPRVRDPERSYTTETA